MLRYVNSPPPQDTTYGSPTPLEQNNKSTDWPHRCRWEDFFSTKYWIHKSQYDHLTSVLTPSDPPSLLNVSCTRGESGISYWMYWRWTGERNAKEETTYTFTTTFGDTKFFGCIAHPAEESNDWRGDTSLYVFVECCMHKYMWSSTNYLERGENNFGRSTYHLSAHPTKYAKNEA